jgi:uncharacterized protein YegL
MGWRWRKGFRMGPIRTTLSPSGVGWSLGGRWLRCGMSALGRPYVSASVPGTGLSYHQYLDFKGTNMIDQTPFGQHVEFVDNPEPRCPCVLLLDTSASMSGEPIRQLQMGLDQYRDELLGDSLARKRVEVAIITFGNTVQTAHDFTTADALQIPTLQPNGSTPMAGALLEATRMVDRRKQEYKSAGITYYRPWIFLITDGAPTDGDAAWSSAVSELRRGIDSKGYLLFAVGVEGADMNKLGELPAMNGPQKLNGTRFKDLFLWLSQSQKSVSRSKPSDQLQLPSPQWVITT